MFKLFNWFGNKSTNVTKSTNKDAKTTEQKKYLKATPWLRLQIAHSIGLTGEYYVVQILNTALKNPHWEEFSPRFETENEAYYYIECTLMPHNDIGKRRIAFLESLQRNSRREHVESLYYYTSDMFHYFERCPVIDRENVEIQFVSQMDDMGDEYFNCIYEVKKELFKNKDIGDDFKMEYKPIYGGKEISWPLIGMVMAKYKDGRDYGNEHRHYTHIGSNHQNPLRVYLKLNLNNIEVDKVPVYDD